MKLNSQYVSSNDEKLHKKKNGSSNSRENGQQIAAPKTRLSPKILQNKKESPKIYTYANLILKSNPHCFAIMAEEEY